MSERVFGALTCEDAAHLRPQSILLLPLGSMEQHGPHLPLDTDTVLAQALAAKIVETHGAAFDLYRLPALPFGLSREHAWAAGTMTLSVAGMTTLLRETAGAIVRSVPARRLMILNGHGGNRGILDAILHELKSDFGLEVCALHTGALMSPVPDAGLPEIHAGCDETSLMLALAPERVRMDRTSALKNPPAGDAVRAAILDPGVSWPWSSGDRRLADCGVIGDVAGASAERGFAILARILEASEAALRTLSGAEPKAH